MSDAQPDLWGTRTPRPVRRSRRDLERSIRARRERGGLEEPDRLLVSLARTAADVADETRGDDDARYHHHQALRLLADLEERMHLRAGATGGDSFEQLLALAAGPTAPRDTAD